MLEEKVSSLIEQPLEAIGYELVRVKFISSDVLQIMIDAENGVNIDDCTKATRLINNILQVAEIVDYSLEVSSPGMDRPLIKPKHYQKFIGSAVKIVINELIDGRKKFIGRLKSFDNDKNTLKLEFEDKIIELSLDQIQQTNIYINPLKTSKEKKRN